MTEPIVGHRVTVEEAGTVVAFDPVASPPRERDVPRAAPPPAAAPPKRTYNVAPLLARRAANRARQERDLAEALARRPRLLVERIETAIAAHPRCTSYDIAAATGIIQGTVSARLTILCRTGRVTRTAAKPYRYSIAAGVTP
jgi:hypothetical protein